jgi:transketolase
MGDLQEKFEAFGWKVISIKNGNDISSIFEGLKLAKSETNKGKPICVLLHTEMGNGVDFMMHTHAWHGKAPNDEQLATGLAQNEETLGDY